MGFAEEAESVTARRLRKALAMVPWYIWPVVGVAMLLGIAVIATAIFIG